MMVRRVMNDREMCPARRFRAPQARETTERDPFRNRPTWCQTAALGLHVFPRFTGNAHPACFFAKIDHFAPVCRLMKRGETALTLYFLVGTL